MGLLRLSASCFQPRVSRRTGLAAAGAAARDNFLGLVPQQQVRLVSVKAERPSDHVKPPRENLMPIK